MCLHSMGSRPSRPSRVSGLLLEPCWGEARDARQVEKVPGIEAVSAGNRGHEKDLQQGKGMYHILGLLPLAAEHRPVGLGTVRRAL